MAKHVLPCQRPKVEDSQVETRPWKAGQWEARLARPEPRCPAGLSLKRLTSDFEEETDWDLPGVSSALDECR